MKRTAKDLGYDVVKQPQGDGRGIKGCFEDGRFRVDLDESILRAALQGGTLGEYIEFLDAFPCSAEARDRVARLFIRRIFSERDCHRNQHSQAPSRPEPVYPSSFTAYQARKSEVHEERGPQVANPHAVLRYLQELSSEKAS